MTEATISGSGAAVYSLMHGWARYYAALGWAIFPLVPGTKSPFKDSKGSTEATTDLTQIDAWWFAHPDANIAIKPSASGLYVFDVDPRNGGSESFNRLVETYGRFHSPLQVESPGGGFHLYYAHRTGRKHVGQPAQGIDGKYNGYAVLPPSVHPNGGRYAWLDLNARPAPVPEWLLSPERAERPVSTHAGDLADAARIELALDGRDPEDYYSWINAIASIKHWEDNTEGAEGVGFEIARAWSDLSPKHDDGAFEDKWNSFDSSRPDARTLGSLLHEAGMTRPGAEVAFAEPPVVPAPKPAQWTSVSVEGFGGPTDPTVIMAEMMADDVRGFAKSLAAGDVGRVVALLAWRTGSNCELSLAVLRQAFPESQELRDAITIACASCSDWYSVAPKREGKVLTLEVDGGALDRCEMLVRQILPTIDGLYQRDGDLCTITSEGRIRRHDVDSFGSFLDKHFLFVKGVKKAITDAPDKLIRRCLAGDVAGVPRLDAVVPLPYVRPNGTVAGKGYDDKASLFVRGDLPRPVAVLDKAGVAAALERLWAPFAGYLFMGETDRAALMAAMLTAVSRVGLPTAPAFLVDAQSQGTGKSKLCECLALLTGSGYTTNTLPSKSEEVAKTLVALMLPSPLVVAFDNVKGSIKDGSEVCAALTSETYVARTLGSNGLAALPNRALWLFNGNNVRLIGDTTRRFLRIGLESPQNAFLRQFDFDPVERIKASLGDMRGDLLDLIATWVADGRPGHGGAALGSYGPWDALVRNVVIWLGFVDPVEGVVEEMKADPYAEVLDRLMYVWGKRFGSEWVKTRSALTQPMTGELNEAWQDIMEEIGKGKPVTPIMLGNFLSGRKLTKRELGKFVDNGDKNFRAWRLEPL